MDLLMIQKKEGHLIPDHSGPQVAETMANKVLGKWRPLLSTARQSQKATGARRPRGHTVYGNGVALSEIQHTKSMILNSSIYGAPGWHGG